MYELPTCHLFLPGYWCWLSCRAWTSWEAPPGSQCSLTLPAAKPPLHLPHPCECSGGAAAPTAQGEAPSGTAAAAPAPSCSSRAAPAPWAVQSCSRGLMLTSRSCSRRLQRCRQQPCNPQDTDLGSTARPAACKAALEACVPHYIPVVKAVSAHDTVMLSQLARCSSNAQYQH